MSHPIAAIHNFIKTLTSFDWILLIITITVCILTMYIGFLVASPMGMIPI